MKKIKKATKNDLSWIQGIIRKIKKIIHKK